DAFRVELAVARVAVEQARVEPEAAIAGDRGVLEQESARDADVLRARPLELLACLAPGIASAFGVGELARHAAQDGAALIATIEAVEAIELVFGRLLDELRARLRREVRDQVREPQRAPRSVAIELVRVEPVDDLALVVAVRVAQQIAIAGEGRRALEVGKARERRDQG